MALDDASRIALTSAAVTATGPIADYYNEVEVPDGKGEGGTITTRVPDPAAWQASVLSNAVNLMVLTGPLGDVTKAMNQVDTTRSEVKVFHGTIVGVFKEARSTRAIVTLHTGSDKAPKDGYPEGTETVRTERTDNASGVLMARQAQALRGHRVLVHVEIETMGGDSGRKVRVVRHIQDLGVDPAAESKGLGSVPRP